MEIKVCVRKENLPAPPPPPKQTYKVSLELTEDEARALRAIGGGAMGPVRKALTAAFEEAKQGSMDPYNRVDIQPAQDVVVGLIERVYDAYTQNNY